MLPLISRPTLASTSTSRVLLSAAAPGSAVRHASGPSSGQNPHLVTPSDSRTDTIRQVLYPPNSPYPSSSSPTGEYQPQHAERLQAVVGDAEAHETIERAWKLFQRQKREAHRRSLQAKLDAMTEACRELDEITGSGSKEGKYPRTIYDKAMARPTGRPAEDPRGKKGAEARWLEARIDGLVPREAWVPTDTRGKGWNYKWKRPS